MNQAVKVHTPNKLALALLAEYTLRTLWTIMVHDAVLAKRAFVSCANKCEHRRQTYKEYMV